MPKKSLRLAKSAASPKPTPRPRKTGSRDATGPIVDSLGRLADMVQDFQAKLRTQDEAFRQVQADLALLRDRHALLHDLSPVGHLILDAEGRIIEATPRSGMLLGRDLESVIGQPLDQLVAREYHDIIRRHCREVITSGSRQTCEVPIREDTGVNRWIHFESLAMQTSSVSATHWRTALLDVSDRKRAEDVLRFAHFSLDRAADAVYWIDPQARILDVNDTACRMLGYTKEALCRMTVHDLNPDFQAERWPGFWAETEQRGTMVLDTVHVAKDGRHLPVEVSVNFLSYEGREYHCAFVRDITERKRAEESFRLFRTLLDQATDAIHVLDPDTGRFLDCNERGHSSLGYTREELLALSVIDINPVVPFSVFAQKIQECRHVPHGQTIAIETMHRRKDGSAFPVEVSPRIIQLDREYCLAIVRDITERKNAEFALKQSEEHFRTLIEHSSDIVTVLGTDGAIQFQSPSIERLLGYGQGELKGRIAFELIHQDDVPLVMERFQAILDQHGRLQTVQYRFRHKDGSWRYFESIAHLISGVHGRPAVIVNSRDVTDRELAEEALQRSEAFISSVVENLPSMILVKDAKDLTFVRVNKAGEELLGRSRDELIGKSAYELFPEADANARWESDLQVLASRRSLDIQEDHIRIKGRRDRILHTRKIPILDSSGTPQYLLVISDDLTEQKRLEAQFRQAQKMEAVGQLAGGVAHDFNNLLTVINGYSALLVSRLASNTPEAGMAAESLKAGERAAELTKQLLAFSRKQVLVLQPLNLNDSLRSISSMLSRLLRDDVTLKMDLATDLWSINGDKGQLDQVTMNLAVNARDAMPNGGQLTIVTRNFTATPEFQERHHMVAEGDYVHVRVSDTGQGMSPEVLSHLFEPFFTTKEVGRGTGLGLATVYGIVKQSQGYIFAESTMGQGTTFHVYYPRVEDVPVASAVSRSGSVEGSETLLVVEDQDSVREFITHTLKRYGYRVLEATNGEQALRIAATLTETIHMLVTDVVMPEVSGTLVAERMRLVWPSLRVLFISGYSDLITSTMLQEPGTAFLDKPFLPDDLVRHVRELLDKKR